ncbi:hypothetical protein C8J57DRAFT_1520390 [Mycena rebaudengoi]|nr:hypothetical protein C8J57DRAFT_1520390 [Mycena rebaudengoi]
MVEEKADQQSEADAKQEQPLSYPLSKLLVHFVALSAAEPTDHFVSKIMSTDNRRSMWRPPLVTQDPLLWSSGLPNRSPASTSRLIHPDLAASPKTCSYHTDPVQRIPAQCLFVSKSSCTACTAYMGLRRVYRTRLTAAHRDSAGEWILPDLAATHPPRQQLALRLSSSAKAVFSTPFALYADDSPHIIEHTLSTATFAGPQRFFCPLSTTRSTGLTGATQFLATPIFDSSRPPALPHLVYPRAPPIRPSGARFWSAPIAGSAADVVEWDFDSSSRDMLVWAARRQSQPWRAWTAPVAPIARGTYITYVFVTACRSRRSEIVGNCWENIHLKQAKFSQVF